MQGFLYKPTTWTVNLFIQDKEEIWNIETRPGIQLKTGPIFL